MPKNTTGRAFVAYMRVSTDKQGKSGLGLEAQRAAIDAYMKLGDRLLLPPFIETESGKKSDRPKLAEALAKCRKTGATLLVAKLDRLSRSVVFLRTLIDSGVDVGFCDLPQIPPGAMGRFLLTQMAAVAELEAGLVSERTKAALAAAKARGVRLGGDRGYRPTVPPDWTRGVPAASAARSQRADHAAHALAPVIEELRQEGVQSFLGLAAALNARNIQTPRRGPWTATTVRRVLARLEA
jgi:DNA invertase Pin-like site-specific DNA recombinase